MSDVILSYIGFAIKAGKVKKGVNACRSIKGRVPLFILCATASDNTKKDALSLALKHNSRIIVSEYKLEDIVNKQNCKLIAVMDNELAKAIIKNSNEHFVILEAEN